MKKILIILLSYLLICCDRHPLYLPEDAQVNIVINIEANIDNLWNENWRQELKYNWDENKYGKIGYTRPKYISSIFFNNFIIHHSQDLQVNASTFIPISSQSIYDILLYNQTNTTHINQDYTIESSNEENLYYDSDFSTTYNTKQPGELFATYLGNIDFSKLKYDIIYTSKQTLLYHIDAILHPISYIYIIQFIIINDDNSPTIEAKDINQFSITNIANKKSLFTSNPIFTGTKQISSLDIKEGQLHGDSLIFASRITVMDLIPDKEISSWASHDHDINYLITLNVSTHNYGIISGSRNIRDQLLDNPHGGIITITINNSDLKQSGTSISGGFGINIDNWEEHIYDIR